MKPVAINIKPITIKKSAINNFCEASAGDSDGSVLKRDNNNSISRFSLSMTIPHHKNLHDLLSFQESSTSFKITVSDEEHKSCEKLPMKFVRFSVPDLWLTAGGDIFTTPSASKTTTDIENNN